MNKSFGVGEFKVVCDVDKIQLIIHDDQIVAETKEDVYNMLFDVAVTMLGGRIDNRGED